MRTSQKWNDINCYVERGWTCKIPKGVDPSIRPIEINELFPSKFLIKKKIFIT